MKKKKTLGDIENSIITALLKLEKKRPDLKIKKIKISEKRKTNKN